MSAPAVIEADGLTKDFGEHRGLFGLDLAAEPGRVHGFLGPNGAGKTTTIRLLLDLLRPTGGSARILGLDVREHSRDIRRRVGYVPGDLALPPRLTGREYLDQSAALRDGVDLDRRQGLVTRLFADLAPRIGKLSKGNRQKIALIDALQHQPEVLILDEPTDGLDPLLRQQVKGILREHAAAGGTVFLSSHVVHEVQTTCDDVSILIGGRLRAQAAIADLVEEEGLVVEAHLPDPAKAIATLPHFGATDLERQGRRLRLRVQGHPLRCLAALHALGATNVRLRQGDLEERFLRLYATGGDAASAGTP